MHVRPSHTPPHRRPGWFVTLVNDALSNDRDRFREGTWGDDQSCRAAGITAIPYPGAVGASFARKYCAHRALRNKRRRKSVGRYEYYVNALPFPSSRDISSWRHARHNYLRTVMT